jgi:agmatine/peptidylarginine deiminase
MNFRFILVACLVVMAMAVQAQQGITQAQRNNAIQKVSTMSGEEIRAGYMATKGRQVVSAEAVRAHLLQQGMVKPAPSTPSKGLTLPAGLRVPGEFEEVDAIFINWPYVSLDTNNNWAEQMFEGWGPYYNAQGAYLGLGPVISFVDTLANSPFPPIFQKIISGIAPHAEVWINIWVGDDSVTVKNYMASKGTPLTNYRFFINPGNSFWYRDCGPVGFYYGSNDSVAFLDYEYYGGRPLDDQLPIHLGAQAGYPVYTTTIENEGGNILLDGLGTLFTSTAVYGANADTYGQYYLSQPGNPSSLSMITKTPVSQAALRDSLSHLMNLSRCIVLPALRFDGGTGHVDLYADMWDENTFVTTQYPAVMSNNIDYNRIETNINTITSTNSYFNKPYANSRIPLPTKDNGNWYTSGYDFENYTRTYSNHLIVNRAIIQPVYSNGTTGNVAGMQADLEIIRREYPGYEIIPVDVRAFDGFGGAIHCITKQIPARNPLHIFHGPVRGAHNDHLFNIEAIVQNQSGIASASVYWRIKGSSVWNMVPMAAQGSDIYLAQIAGNAAAVADTIEYYIAAQSVNGKSMTKPMTAPDGFYTFCHGSSYISTDVPGRAMWSVSEFMPNPTSQSSVIVWDALPEGGVWVNGYDATGRRFLQTHKDHTEFSLDAAALKKGMYLFHFTTTDGRRAVRKLMVE